jgi:cysteine desulfurase
MIYLDNAATTKPYESSVKLLCEYTQKHYYNISSVYLPAFEIKKTVKKARQTLSDLLGCNASECYFTSGATESNNLFLKGVITGNKSDEYIFNNAEHSSVYEIAKYIKNKGYKVHFVNLNKTGQVDINHLLSLVNKNTKLVSVSHINNEVGSINDIKKIATEVKKLNANTLVHSDGVQAFGKLSVNVKHLGVDAYTISSHKVYGPKGVGAIYINNKVNVKPLIIGGGQEYNVRSGTENVAGIIAFVNSASILNKKLQQNYDNASKLKKLFISKITSLKDVNIVNNSKNHSSYILTLTVPGIKAEILLHLLAKQGVIVSTGSSCSSNIKHSTNRTLDSMGLSKEQIEGSIRISFSETNTVEEIEEASSIFIKTVQELKQKIT